MGLREWGGLSLRFHYNWDREKGEGAEGIGVWAAVDTRNFLTATLTCVVVALIVILVVKCACGSINESLQTILSSAEIMATPLKEMLSHVNGNKSCVFVCIFLSLCVGVKSLNCRTLETNTVCIFKFFLFLFLFFIIDGFQILFNVLCGYRLSLNWCIPLEFYRRMLVLFVFHSRYIRHDCGLVVFLFVLCQQITEEWRAIDFQDADSAVMGVTKITDVSNWHKFATQR